MQNCTQMRESKCTKDILKCANEKCWTKVGAIANLILLTKNDMTVHNNKFPNLGFYSANFPNLGLPMHIAV